MCISDIHYEASNMDNAEAETQDPLDGSFVEVATTPAFECGICERTFAKKKTLKRHMNVHDGSKVQCGKCTLFFDSVGALEAHKKIKHQKKCLCTSCGMRFERKVDLSRHAKEKHEERPLKCPFNDCPKAFVARELYQDHLNKHSGSKPHSCAGCVRTFSDRYKRNVHQKVCLGEKEFKCETCGATFQEDDALKNHKNAQH